MNSRKARVGCGLSIVAASIVAACSASAFELKHAADGKTVRWGSSRVAYVIDPSVEDAVPGGSAAVASAVDAWSSVGDGPSLSSSVGPGGALPRFDGQNSILFAPDGFEPAGHALAVTVSTIDDSTGDLLDTDIVINGAHRFAVLPAGASDLGAKPMPTDGAGEDDGARSSFDLEHVVAHEVGHSLGMADVHDESSALMYAMTAPGSAANRAPTSDDEAGLQSLYAGSASAQNPKTGCGNASVAGAHARAGDAWFGFVALGLAGCWASGRRRKSASFALPIALGALVLVAAPGASSPATTTWASATTLATETARVASTTTRDVHGVLQTRLDLVAVACGAAERCPAHSRAVVWGGVRDGILQRVDGAPVPRVGDVIDVAFVPGRDDVVVRSGTSS